jgi:hypothetical protein
MYLSSMLAILGLWRDRQAFAGMKRKKREREAAISLRGEFYCC